MKVGEIDFRKWYTSKKHLAEDVKRDIYPPRFITHLKCYRPSILDVTYILQVREGSIIVKDYNFGIFVKPSHGGNTKYSHTKGCYYSYCKGKI